MKTHKMCQVNQSQSIAISHGKGPMLVLAGPGSGKTFTITQRILYLIESCQIEPEHILVITFTKAAAKEMQERFIRAVGGKSVPVSFGTFHAIFFSILKYSDCMETSSILKESEKRKILKKILQKMELYDGAEMIARATLEISKCKNTGADPHKTDTQIGTTEEFCRLYEAYRQELEKQHKIDFDDMILRCYQLLKEKEAVRRLWQEHFQYILVDEFQDINMMQYEVVKLLSAPQNNLFVVGDDDQSIYGFRGSDPKIMKQFMNDYPQAKTVVLHKNYRSKSDIVTHSLKLIQHNENRYEKQLEAANEEHNGVKLYCFSNKESQINHVIKAVTQYMQKEGAKYADIAIIYRTIGHAVMTAEKMTKAGIPFSIVEKPKHIYESETAKDILAYVKLALDNRKKEEFYRVMNRPVRYITRESVPRGELSMEALVENNHGKDYVIHNIIQFYRQLEFLKDMSPYAAINYIRKGMHYDTYIREKSGKTEQEVKEEIEVLEQLQTGAKDFATLQEWLTFIKKCDEELSMVSHSGGEKDAVCLVTMHASKGLEWPFVVIPDLNEGVVPHKKAVTKEEIEEERRMLYVAMTRAKEHLFLFCVAQKQVYQNQPSRFLYEIYDDLHIL